MDLLDATEPKYFINLFHILTEIGYKMVVSEKNTNSLKNGQRSRGPSPNSNGGTTSPVATDDEGGESMVFQNLLNLNPKLRILMIIYEFSVSVLIVTLKRFLKIRFFVCRENPRGEGLPSSVSGFSPR